MNLCVPRLGFEECHLQSGSISLAGCRVTRSYHAWRIQLGSETEQQRYWSTSREHCDTFESGLDYKQRSESEFH